MTNDSEQTIASLHVNQRSFAIRLKIIRLGHRTCGSNSNTTYWKLIMIDNEGVQIGVTIFKDQVNLYEGKLEANKTYMISNAQVDAVDKKYQFVHPEKQLIINRQTVIKESTDIIEHKINHDFVEFSKIRSKVTNKQEFDIRGVLVKVDEIKPVVSKINGGAIVLRNITIMNKEKKIMEICLWEDMAKNEGYQLQEVLGQNPIIAITRIAGKIYLDDIQLRSTMRSILTINPQCDEIDESEEMMTFDIYDPLKVVALRMIQKIQTAKEVTLKDLIENQDALSTDTSYYFTGKVEKVENKPRIWYDSCQRCKKSCSKNVENPICRHCNEIVIDTVPRYLVILSVTQGDYSAQITLFEDAASVYVGCNVDEYIQSINEGEQHSTYYRALSLQTSTEMRFMTKLNDVKIDRRLPTIVVGAIQKIQNELVQQPNSESVEDPKSSQSDGESQPIKENPTRRKKETTDVVQPIQVQRKGKRKLTKKMSQECNDEKESTAEVQATEVQGKRTRKNTKKMLEDCIDITSDDDLTLEKFKTKSKKNKMKAVPIIKIKQEKK